MRVAPLVCVSALLSPANGLKECLTIPSFSLTDHAHGQCQPSKHPGAFYGTQEEELKDDIEWYCWTPEEHIEKESDADIEFKAKTLGFAGACTFAAYKSSATPEEVPLCSKFLDHNPPDCHPGPGKYWGACLNDISVKPKCIPKDDTELVAGVAKGDCKYFSVHDDPPFLNGDYNSVCRFGPDKPFKCPTVPSYVAEDKRTCSSRSEEGEEVHPFGSACFSLAEGTGWSCRAEAAQEASSCTWTFVKGVKAFMKRMAFGGTYYDGLCLFPGSPGYDRASDWQEPVQVSMTHGKAITIIGDFQRTSTPFAFAPRKQQGASIGGVLTFVLSLLSLAAAAGGFFLSRQRASGAREQPLVGDVGAGSEMAAAQSGEYIAD